MTDIYGANLYNRYLEERVKGKNHTRTKMAAATGSPTTTTTTTTTAGPQEGELDHAWAGELALPSATSCKSLLVCTGVYNPSTEAASSSANQHIKENVFHGHRDFRFDPELVEPGHVVLDVNEAVDLIFHKENFVP